MFSYEDIIQVINTTSRPAVIKITNVNNFSDIDECIIKDKMCKLRNKICVNTYGGYSCQCEVGFYEVDELNCTGEMLKLL